MQCNCRWQFCDVRLICTCIWPMLELYLSRHLNLSYQGKLFKSLHTDRITGLRCHGNLSSVSGGFSVISSSVQAATAVFPQCRLSQTSHPFLYKIPFFRRPLTITSKAWGSNENLIVRESCRIFLRETTFHLCCYCIKKSTPLPPMICPPRKRDATKHYSAGLSHHKRYTPHHSPSFPFPFGPMWGNVIFFFARPPERCQPPRGPSTTRVTE